ncbi:hypothetical protein PACTADRAFT_32300 [Pachysolen tannophilus NRRL Y-2460]|uniref:Brl1/Brr6 domain-containing protein n=1 Tax=Pachysolen tannophilus NRRL Y-2460 TaxID=669874 RepID=A0A1E4TYG0_PACTA|nr:hypothetical protein PACTADRAFT_32300 [Pachysolen tannophilus NRRL Y-2460]
MASSQFGDSNNLDESLLISSLSLGESVSNSDLMQLETPFKQGDSDDSNNNNNNNNNNMKHSLNVSSLRRAYDIDGDVIMTDSPLPKRYYNYFDTIKKVQDIRTSNNTTGTMDMNGYGYNYGTVIGDANAHKDGNNNDRNKNMSLDLLNLQNKLQVIDSDIEILNHREEDILTNYDTENVDINTNYNEEKEDLQTPQVVTYKKNGGDSLIKTILSPTLLGAKTAYKISPHSNPKKLLLEMPQQEAEFQEKCKWGTDHGNQEEEEEEILEYDTAKNAVAVSNYNYMGSINRDSSSSNVTIQEPDDNFGNQVRQLWNRNENDPALPIQFQLHQHQHQHHHHYYNNNNNNNNNNSQLQKNNSAGANGNSLTKVSPTTSGPSVPSSQRFQSLAQNQQQHRLDLEPYYLPSPWMVKISKFPYVISSYLQIFFNILIAGYFAVVVFKMTKTINFDINLKIKENLNNIHSEAILCRKHYEINMCSPETIAPALHKQCQTWEKCMLKDPYLLLPDGRADNSDTTFFLNKASIGAEIFGGVINSLVEPIDYKNLIKILLLAISIFLLNFMFGYLRYKLFYYQETKYESKKNI